MAAYFKKGENHDFKPWMKPIKIVSPKAGTERNRAPRGLPVGIYLTSSAKETEKIGEKIARKLPGRVLALVGELGSGKTTFVKGLAKGLGIKKRVLSPTFVLIRQYANLYHVDLYRLANEQGAKGLGLEEILSNPENIVVIEWAEKIKSVLPRKTVFINFYHLGENKRKIEIK